MHYVPALCGQELTYLNKINRYRLKNVSCLKLCLSIIFVNDDHRDTSQQNGFHFIYMIDFV